jgi:spermidine/putrescine transport system ATP-binding protein
VDASPAELSAVTARNLKRCFGAIAALDDVSLEIRRGEFFSLLGPSGCGKTTFLRVVAGLDFPDSGTLEIGGADALPVPAHRRHVNTVFQSYALFPHMSVRDNVAFGLRMKRLPSEELRSRVERVLDLAHITDLRDRHPHQLSGGQKQRVALARAVVNEPGVLLLDEPLAALDVKLRRTLQQELRSLQRRLGITFVLVTHDQDEAISLSDRIAIMNAGKIVQEGVPADLYDRPRNRFVAQFVGGCNLIPASCDEANQHAARASFGELAMATPCRAGKVTLAVRPEKIVSGPNVTSVNRFEGRIEETTYTGPETHLTIDAAGQKLLAVALNCGGARSFNPGERIAFSIPPEALLVLED